jgi:hypothetical protein
MVDQYRPRYFVSFTAHIAFIVVFGYDLPGEFPPIA